jgi:predicted  nucleic acid-binding Zn-ribbon protein
MFLTQKNLKKLKKKQKKINNKVIEVQAVKESVKNEIQRKIG